MSDFSKARLLKDGRERAKLTLEQVAKQLGVNRSTVSRWENGEINRIKLSDLRALSALYGIDINSLIGENAQLISSSPVLGVPISDEEHFLLSLFRKASDIDRERVFSILLPYGD